MKPTNNKTYGIPENFGEKMQDLFKMPGDKLLQAYNILSRGLWPDDIIAKPEDWDERPEDNKEEITLFTARYIEFERGFKAIERLRKVGHGYTDQEFEDWWDSTMGRSLNRFEMEEIVEKALERHYRKDAEENKEIRKALKDHNRSLIFLGIAFIIHVITILIFR